MRQSDTSQLETDSSRHGTVGFCFNAVKREPIANGLIRPIPDRECAGRIDFA